MKPRPGMKVVDTRSPAEFGMFCQWSVCGRFGVVKFPGRKSVIIPTRYLGRGPYHGKKQYQDRKPCVGNAPTAGMENPVSPAT